MGIAIDWARSALVCACVWTGCDRKPLEAVVPVVQATDARESERIHELAAELLRENARAVGVAVIDERSARHYALGPRSVREPDGPAFDADTTFEIGSVSKVFAGLMLADAEQRGELTLDDPIARELPDWKLPEHNGRAMTLRHAATHLTGLPNMPGNWQTVDKGRTRYTHAHFREYLASHVLATTPGERYVYSNLGSALIALALEHKTGRAYSELLTDRIFAPLGLQRTGYSDKRYRIDANMLDGYEEDDAPSIPRLDVSPVGPCCVIRSSLRDMSQFATAALNPKHPLAAVFVRAAEPQRPLDPLEPEGRWIALGWELDRRFNILRKSGQVAGYRSELMLQPSEQRGLFVVVNSMHADITGLSNRLIETLWDPRPAHAAGALQAALVPRLPGSLQTSDAVFDSQIQLEGWVAPAHVRRGSTIEIELYFRALKPISEDWRIFIHGDSAVPESERARRDHYPSAGGSSFSTRDWQPGMIIRDAFLWTIPSTTPVGELTVWLGFNRGARRMPITSARSKIDDNRLRGPQLQIDPAE